MQRRMFILLIQLTVLQSFGQINPSFHPPLNIPMFLSGNFGEIRSDHFHSGIDIKTQGTTGHHVFAIEDGYVSRIKIQANGYGKSLYITHPNGYTSVYGHLDRYREDIEAWVKEFQYRRQSHQVDIYPDPGEFRISKGTFIAYSGNTGGSSGPHLHFEIRTSGNQHPTNVLKYGFDIKDQRAPKFHTLYLVNTGKGGHVNGIQGKQSFNLVIDNGYYMVPWGTLLVAGGEVGIVAEVFDYLDGVPNRCGVYAMELYVDNKLVYSHVMDEFSFSETRYVNAHIDYMEQVSSGKKAHRLFRLPNDKLRIYGPLENNGILTIDENRDYPVRVVATDVAGNRSEMRFTIAGKPGLRPPLEEPARITKQMHYQENSEFQNDHILVEIPAVALYEDMGFIYSDSAGNGDFLTGIHRIHHPGVPLHLPFTLSVKVPEMDPDLRDKLIVVQLMKGEVSAAGGAFKNGVVTASLRNFGDFAVTLDTIPPEIIPQNGIHEGNLSGRRSMKFTVRDDLSGVEQYEGYIDNRWALFEYDPKNDLLNYTFDEERVDRDQSHEIELYVTDSKGNVSLFHTTFTW